MPERDDLSPTEAQQREREVAPGVFTGDIGPLEFDFQQARHEGRLSGLDEWLALEEAEEIEAVEGLAADEAVTEVVDLD